MPCDLCTLEIITSYTNKKGHGTYCRYCNKLINKLIDAVELEEGKSPSNRMNLLDCNIEFKEIIYVK